ncbi:hypothetical protein QUB63_05745 [Microcoleus sp. ARI1-B5]|uniref:hypothetical protein n=1 Tax=unclassified Microcoleus TaxID=2642155 RepID=UPI002FCEDAE6
MSNQASNIPSLDLAMVPGTVYIQDCVSNQLSKLYTLDLATGKATFIGEIITEVYDIAFVDSQLYGIDREGGTTQLVKIDIKTGDTIVIGDTGFATAGLAYNAQRQTLYASTAKQLIALDLKTGKGTPVATVANKDYNCGEVAFDSNGIAYITLIGYQKKKLLARCNLDTSEVKTLGDTGFPGIGSMDFVGNVLYGVTGRFFNLGKDGQLIRINTQTGKGTLVAQTKPSGRWAGIAVYQPAAEAIATITPKVNTEATQAAQTTTTTREATMKLLTIDAKANCYVINTDQMNNLQQNVAKSLTLDKGTFDIQITSGSYSYSADTTVGEPFVFLWIYGLDGSTFINTNTGAQTGATWATLNGYNDKLQLDIKEKAVVCALFFDIYSGDNQGQVTVSITGNQQNPQTLTVDSKANCYPLDSNSLSNLKKANANSIELAPGNYRVKIRESNATYGAEAKNFQLEPWALLLIQGGKFISKLTGNEVSESWCSLNGFKDDVIFEVKQKTTISGFFFDTYIEDNQGQVVLEINNISDEEVDQEKAQSSLQPGTGSSESSVSVVGGGSTTSSGRIPVTSGSTTSSSSTGVTSGSTTSSSSTGVTSGGGTTSSGGISVTTGGTTSSGTENINIGSGFNFSFDQAQMEQMWQQMASQINTSITVTDDPNEKKEAYWDNLEKWLLKGYQTQAKDLGMRVARLDFMFKTLTQQMEVSFNQNFHNWSAYFNKTLNDLFISRVPRLVSEQVNLRISEQTQEIKNLVLQQMQTELNERIESVVNLKVSNQTQEVKNLVVQQMQTELEQRIENVVNIKIANQSTEINTQVINQMSADIDERISNSVNVQIANQSQEITNQVIQQLQHNIDQRVENVVSIKISDQTQNVKNLVIQQMQTYIDQRIDNVVNLKVSNLSQDINTQIVQQIQHDIDQRINAVVNLKIADQSQNIKNLVIQQIESNIDARINTAVNQSSTSNVQLVTNNIVNDLDNRINVSLDNKILNFRNDVSTIVKTELNQNFTQNLKNTIFSELRQQQFYLDINLIKSEVENFYSNLAQFENQFYLRIEQGDTQLYNWTLEQLIALQGCLTDRQALGDIFESFAKRLKDELENAECVRPDRFGSWVRTDMRSQFQPTQSPELPQG